VLIEAQGRRIHARAPVQAALARMADIGDRA
jgi:hypothetical protein